MNSKERVHSAISLKEPDRVPIFVTVVPEIESRLFQKYGLRDNELLTFLGNDIVVTNIGVADSFAKIEGAGYKVDEWQIGWKNVTHRRGTYTEIVDRPLEKASYQELAAYAVPDPFVDKRYENAYKLKDMFKEFATMVDLSCTIFEISHYLRGMETLLVDMLENKKFADMLFDKVLEFYIPAAKKIAAIGIDIIWIGDDVGMQTGMIMSPRLFRTYLKDRYKILIDEIKKTNKNVKIAFHSDGYIIPIINDLIEIGVDILNPVQPNCMDPAMVKKEFGNKLCFMGTIDEQHTLPFGSIQDLKSEIDERIKTVGKGGGLIIGPTHNIQNDTELEKIEIMFAYIKDNGIYHHIKL
jgi:uroporphyrinogen decarboxylase